MHTYEYRGFDDAGRAVRGGVDAHSLKDARERLVQQKILPETVRKSVGGIRVTTEWRANMYRELGAMLGAGLTLEQALTQMCDAPELRTQRGLLSGIRESIREGRCVPAAFTEAGLPYGDFEQAALTAAEQAGTLGSVFVTLADFLEDRDRILARVRSALAYPAIVVSVGLCMAVLMLGLLLPWAQRIIEESGGKLPPLTQAMVLLGKTLMGWGGLVLLALLFAGGWWLCRRCREPTHRLVFHRRLLRLPLFGPGACLLANLRFAQTMALLLRGGVTPIDAFRMAGRATGNTWLAAQVGTQADTVQHGERISEALARVPVLGERLPGWIRVGEAGGGLADLIDGAGARYREQWDRYVTRSLAVLEPVLILLIGGFVLLVTLSVLLPILSMSRMIAA